MNTRALVHALLDLGREIEQREQARQSELDAARADGYAQGYEDGQADGELVIELDLSGLADEPEEEFPALMPPPDPRAN